MRQIATAPDGVGLMITSHFGVVREPGGDERVVEVVMVYEDGDLVIFDESKDDGSQWHWPTFAVARKSASERCKARDCCATLTWRTEA